jgi:site-specific recombinase XerD
MVERFFARRRTAQRMRSGPLGPYVDDFAQRLAEQGYKRDGVSRKIRLAADLSRWLARRRMGPNDLDERRVELFLRQRRVVLPNYCGERLALQQLLIQLREIGVAPALSQSPKCTELERITSAFAQYLSQERALAPLTVGQQVAYIRRFLSESFGTKRVCCEALKPADISRHILRHSNTSSHRGSQAIASALRTFLRFLYIRGISNTNLAAAVPRVAHWHLAGVPKFLTAEQIEVLLQRCNQDTAVGQRDYTVLLLLARLGLRAGEVVRMELDDLDWNAGELTVRGKGGLYDRLPLPVEVGEALGNYLRHGRPRCVTRRVFVRMHAPHREFRSSVPVTYLVSKALDRAGLEPVHKGARLLRQSLATHMLRQGASLAQIGEVLRHRDLESTALYAKVDLRALRALAHSWPRTTHECTAV